MGTNPTPGFNSRLKFCIEPVMTDKSTESEHLPIDRWLEWARRDDWHAYFVGSDIRQMLGEIERLREKTLRDYSDGDIAGEFHYRASLAKADEDGKRLAKEINDYVDSHLAEPPHEETAFRRMLTMPVDDEQIDEVDKVLEAARPLVECPTCMRRFKLGEHCDLRTCSLATYPLSRPQHSPQEK